MVVCACASCGVGLGDEGRVCLSPGSGVLSRCLVWWRAEIPHVKDAEALVEPVQTPPRPRWRWGACTKGAARCTAEPRWLSALRRCAPARRLQMLPRMGITATVLDPSDMLGLEEALDKHNVTLYFSESPTNPYMRCVDIKLIAAMCHAKVGQGKRGS